MEVGVIVTPAGSYRLWVDTSNGFPIVQSQATGRMWAPDAWPDAVASAVAEGVDGPGTPAGMTRGPR